MPPTTPASSLPLFLPWGERSRPSPPRTRTFSFHSPRVAPAFFFSPLHTKSQPKDGLHPTRRRCCSNPTVFAGISVACLYWLGMLGTHMMQPDINMPAQRTAVEVVRTLPAHPLSMSTSASYSQETVSPLWTPVINNALLAYGAYWDIRPLQGLKPPFIRILATALDYGEKERDTFPNYARRFDKAGVKCLLHYASSGEQVFVKASFHGHTVYDGAGSFDVLCDVRPVLLSGHKDRKLLPRAVSLTCPECTKPPWAIEVEYRSEAIRFLTSRTDSPPPPPPSNLLAICVRPTYGPYSDVHGVLEFICYYLSMGADWLTFYTTRGMSPSVLLLLRKAMSLGLPIEILPWNYHIPPGPGNTVHEFNQHLATNACNYRHLHFSRHMAVVDFDEFIVPREPYPSLSSLVTALDDQHPQASGYQFLNTFFFPKFGEDPSLSTVALPFRLLHYTQRLPDYPPGNRSKSIVIPSRVVWTNIHGTRRGMGMPVPGYDEVVVPPTQALLHHYRADFPSGQNMMKIDTVTNVMDRALRDASAVRFRERMEAWPPLKALVDFVKEELGRADDVVSV